MGFISSEVDSIPSHLLLIHSLHSLVERSKISGHSWLKTLAFFVVFHFFEDLVILSMTRGAQSAFISSEVDSAPCAALLFHSVHSLVGRSRISSHFEI